jgi:hypothetical protein
MLEMSDYVTHSQENVPNYTGGEPLTLDVVERDTWVCIGLRPAAAEADQQLKCLLTVDEARAVIKGLTEAIERVEKLHPRTH